MTAWIIPSNAGTFDVEGAFEAMPELHWSEVGTSSIAVGDVVYLYSSAPTSAVTHMCVVMAVGVGADQLINDSAFWRDPSALEDRVNRRSWMRLRLLRRLEPSERFQLTLRDLNAHGVRGTMSGRQRLGDEAIAYFNTIIAAETTDDASAEGSEFDLAELVSMTAKIENSDFSVPDRYVTSKSRGSAQRAFADVVKRNYEYCCAVTGIRTRAFLVASHIVPWNADESIRLDPRNGICLSTLVDRAFDSGFLEIAPEGIVRVNRARIRDDPALLNDLARYDGVTLRAPLADPPHSEYLRRRMESTTGYPDPSTPD